MTATMSDTFAIRPVSDVEAVITREFDAPRDLVFQVYTDPAHIPQWWGPRSTKQFFDYISAAMPYGQPSLTTEAYEQIAAFVLQSNGAVAGESALSGSTAVIIGDLVAAH